MNARRIAAVLLSVLAVAVPGCGERSPEAAATPEALSIEVLSRVPHDPDAFTQGLVFDDDGRLFESVGLLGRSSVREVDVATGDVLREQPLSSDEFGEGLAIGPDGLVQLTWQSGVARRWSTDELDDRGAFAYSGEGWGLAYDGDAFLQSDGSATITRRDDVTFEEIDRIEVTRDGVPVDELNELEWVDGVLYANVWHSDEIMRVDPTSGVVTGVIDLASLWTAPERTSEMTLNGIAHRQGDDVDRLWVTGKQWPEMFEVKVVSP